MTVASYKVEGGLVALSLSLDLGSHAVLRATKDPVDTERLRR